MLEFSEEDKLYSSQKNNHISELTKAISNKIIKNDISNKRISLRILNEEENLKINEQEQIKNNKLNLNNEKEKVLVNLDENKARIQFLRKGSMSITKIEKDPTCWEKFSVITLKILENNYYVIFMCLITFFVLFSNDINSGFLPIGTDFYFKIASLCAFVLFSLEIILSSLVRENYLFSFFFWLDVLSTLSLLMEIDFIFNPIIDALTGNSQNGSSMASKNIAKASSASKLTRVLRVIRVLRLIRIVKLYKNALIAKANIDKKKNEQKRLLDMEKNKKETSISSSKSRFDEMNNVINLPDTKSKGVSDSKDILFEKPIKSFKHLALHQEIKGDPLINVIKNKGRRSTFHSKHQPLNLIFPNKVIKKIEIEKPNPKSTNVDDQSQIKESKISQMLTESMVKKIIIIILILLFILPFCDSSFWSNDSTNQYYVLLEIIGKYNKYNLIHRMNKSLINISSNFNNTINKLILVSDHSVPIINITCNDYLFYVNQSESIKNFRTTEINTLISLDGQTTIIYNNFIDVYINSVLGIIRTIFICFVLTFSAIIFENDTKKLILEPLEIMIEIVENVAKDPINAKNVDDVQNAGMKAMLAELDMSDEKKKKQKANIEKYEVKIIQNAILKISALLAIGFGEAGGEIIKKNLAGSSELQAMIKGKKKNAIFGFCDIRNFQVILMALQEKTMVFVNEIADIVHSSVDRYGGAANKNIGDAFLCAWKFDKKEKDEKKFNKLNEKGDLVLDIDSPIVKNVADQSLLGFLKILIKINREQNILNYRNDKKINELLNNFKVNMGFGLHLGYAIEGAIGSQYKIDASYLSPNVNIAARLEGATRHYGVNILISGELFDSFSSEIQDLCRLIDIVKVKGSKMPVRLYTVDTNIDLTPKNLRMNNLELSNKKKIYESKREKVIKGIEKSNSVYNYISNLPSFKELFYLDRSPDFLDIFNDGCQNYIEGNWDYAKTALEECLELDPFDGPTKTIINFMKETNYQVPIDWEKCRELKSK